MERYTLVMLDVDGTLVSETGRVSERVKTAIHRVKDAGVHVSLCTGRLAITCQSLVEELDLDCYGVYYSGSLLKNLLRDSVLRKHPLPADVSREIVTFARIHEIYLEAHTEQAYLYERQNAYSDFQASTLGVHPIHANLLDVVSTHEVLKLQFVTERPEDLRRIEEFQQTMVSLISLKKFILRTP